MLRVQAKLRRLMMIAGLTLGLGILAVSIAVIYRLVIADDDTPSSTIAEGERLAGDVAWSEVGLSAGAELISSAIDGDRMALVFNDAGRTVTLLVDTTTMAIVGRLAIGGAAQ